MPERGIGPHTDMQRAIWSALEERLEDHIHLDLNDPEEAAQFSAMVEQVEAAIQGESVVFQTEYGVSLHAKPGDPRENRATGPVVPVTPWPTIERAQEMAALNPNYIPSYHRRRKAGPWFPFTPEEQS